MEPSKCLRGAKWSLAPSPVKSRSAKLLKYPCEQFDVSHLESHLHLDYNNFYKIHKSYVHINSATQVFFKSIRRYGSLHPILILPYCSLYLIAISGS